ncbi:MAG TPA: S4 domain-containing protein [Candidatus Krumholzibacterium sp.]|nr:S4 domain-containing protein [Candidatus Krumholzibacterium sp.]
MRIDLLLKNLCLVKTRGMARKGLETGSVKLNGIETKPSREVSEGDVIEIRYPDRVLVIELTAIPAGQVSKSGRTGYFRIIREKPLHGDGGGWNV